MAQFEVLKPAIWSADTSTRAVFSLRNPHWNAERYIQGLNLSVSTHDDREVVLNNRQLFYHSIGLSETMVARGTQVHGNTVHIVTQGGIHGDGDGFVTNTPGVAVSVMVADCAAILLADRSAGVLGALHAGWRGTVGGIIKRGIESMVALGAHPANTKAYIGPCISESCFELGEEVAAQFPDQYVDRSKSKPRADIRKWLSDQLLDEGLIKSHLEVDTSCTYTNDDRYYSYRREGDASGRMMALIWMVN